MLGLEGLTDGGDAIDLAPDVLAAANINPITRLATDYLNHFNNVVMLLEFVSTMPDFVEEVLQWHPVDYRAYFATSHFRHRDLAIAAFAASDPALRARFEAVIGELNAAVGAAQVLLTSQNAEDPTVSANLMELLRGRMQPLITQASGVINGTDVVTEAEVDPHAGNAQTSIDEFFP